MPIQAMLAKHDVRFKLLAAGLRLAGERKLCDLVLSSWKIWKLYNTSTMDFHLFYCSANLQALQARAPSLLHSVHGIPRLGACLCHLLSCRSSTLLYQSLALPSVLA